MARRRFVCIVNKRDEYEVPLALAEAGLLERFVTDLFGPLVGRRWLPAALRRRQRQGIAARSLALVPMAWAVQTIAAVTGRTSAALYARTDRMLARRGATLSRKTGAHLYCYSGFVPPRRELAAGVRVIDFEFHPHPGLIDSILADDAARYPEIAGAPPPDEIANVRDDFLNGWRDADAIVCASGFTARSLVVAGCPADRITVIPYGFSPPAAVARPRPDGPCRFLFVGQGVQRKGLHHLIRCWQDLTPPGAELTLVCYAIEPAIAAMVEAGKGIRLLGRQSRGELDRLYAESDVFVMPSLVEGFGLVYLEAMAAGCHVIATPNTGIPDLPLDTDAATIVAPGDLAALAAAITKLIAAKREERIDPVAIAGQTARRTWAHFRADIAAHARMVADRA